MKKTYMLLLLCASTVFPISQQVCVTALMPLTRDLASLPGSVKSIFVFSVTPDEKERYDHAFIKKRIEKAVMESANLTLVERRSLDASLSELELSSSGAVDPEKVKKIGKMVQADAILFAYPVVAGKYFDLTASKISIMVKAVDVATGAILLVKEYTREETPFFNIHLQFGLPMYQVKQSVMDVYAFTPTYNPAWSFTNEMTHSTPVAFSLLFNFNLAPVDLWAGCDITSFSPVAASNYFSGVFAKHRKSSSAESGTYTNDDPVSIVYSSYAYAMIWLNGGVTLPVSALFGDINNILRLRLGYALGLPAGSDGMSINGMRSSMVMQPSFLHRLRGAIDIGLSSYFDISFMADYTLSGAVRSTIDEAGLVHTLQVGGHLMFSTAVVYKIF